MTRTRSKKTTSQKLTRSDYVENQLHFTPTPKGKKVSTPQKSPMSIISENEPNLSSTQLKKTPQKLPMSSFLENHPHLFPATEKSTPQKLPMSSFLENDPHLSPATEKSTPQKLPMSSFLENQPRFASTPEKKDCTQQDADVSVQGFDCDVTLYESPLKMSPIKACPLSPANSCASDDSYKNIRLFEDDTENNSAIAKKLKHDYSGRKKARKVLFKKDNPSALPPKKLKKQIAESKRLEDWISRINADFAEVDGYELVIE